MDSIVGDVCPAGTVVHALLEESVKESVMKRLQQHDGTSTYQNLSSAYQTHVLKRNTLYAHVLLKQMLNDDDENITEENSFRISLSELYDVFLYFVTN